MSPTIEEKMTDTPAPIFVFGSNLSGIHGAGAARFALQHHGAIWGNGKGLQGNSYGIPTKDESIETLPLIVINVYVGEFLEFAEANEEMIFQVTRIGCGLAGYKNEDIAPMFKDAPFNCILPEEWIPWTRTNEISLSELDMK